MYVTRLTLNGTPPISRRITMTFDERVNLFVGPNAVGKSTILSRIESCIPGAYPDSWFLENIADGVDSDLLAVSEDWREPENGSHMPGSPPPLVIVGSVRQPLPELSDPETGYMETESADEILNGVFSGARVKQAIEMLLDEVWEMEPDRSSPYISLQGDQWMNYHDYPERHNLLKVRKILDDCGKMICGEVIRGSSSQNYVPGPDIRGYLLGPRGAEPIDVYYFLGVDTNDIRNFGYLSPFEAPSPSAYPQDEDALPIYTGHLSSGTQGTLLWIWWLALKMVSHYKFRTDWEKMPVILLIDEIENHLHPTWQRRVIPALLEHFPGLQIFATTHSPFVVAGLKAGQVHLLNRDENGVVTATTNTEDVVGWTADEILRVFMGVDDPTDKDTAEAAAALRKLRDEGPRVDEREEERRQSEIARLRQIVDRAELSGPRVAEDARFLADLESILERHRESQELNQENG